MTRAYKSERHAALNSEFPSDLLRSDALTGPYRRARPYTLTLRMRIERWFRNLMRNF